MKNMKIRIPLQYAFVSIALSISTLSQAASTDVERTKKLSQLTIDLFAEHSKENVLKYGALIANKSEKELNELYKNNLDAIMPDSYALFNQAMKQQLSQEDFKLLEPIFKKQFKFQSDAYASCKLTGKISQPTPTSYSFPLICRLPSANFDSIQQPEKVENESDAQYGARVMNFLLDQLIASPKRDFETQILIHVDKATNIFLPELDDNNYFPTSVSNSITATTQEELAAEDLTE